MSLLISFCNQATSPNLSLLLLDEKNKTSAQWIALPERAYQKYGGMTGLCKTNELIFAVGQIPDKSTELLVFDYEFNLKALHPLEKVKDGHSICIKSDKIYITSTGTDRVIQIEISKDLKKIRESEFWTAEDHDPSNEDNIHLNSMTLIVGDLHISAFGKKESDSWKTALDGYCLNVDKKTRIHTGIQHPHSLTWLNNRLLVCESNAGNLCVGAPGELEINQKFEFGGYLRGISFDGNFYYLGRSADREVSKSTGKKNTSIQVKRDAGILKLDRDFNLVEEISLKGVCSEIYDILFLDNLKTTPEDILVSRVKQLERRVRDITAMYTELLLTRK